MTEERKDVAPGGLYDDGLPKNSYRDLIRARANGFEVSKYELDLWRREEELIRSAMIYASEYKDCGIHPNHFEAPLHQLAWAAIERLLEQCPGTDEIDAPVLLSEMRKLEPECLLSALGRTWLDALWSDHPVPPKYGLETLVNEMKQHQRTKMWRAVMKQIAGRHGQDTDFASLQASYVHAGLKMVMESEDQMFFDDPIDDFAWDPRVVETPGIVKLHVQEIDDVLGGGLGRGEMAVYGGGTGHGKSYFAQYLARHCAEGGGRVLYLSCEDPKELFFCRMVADYAEPKITPKSIRMRKADPEVVETAMARMKENLGGRLFAVEMKKPKTSEVVRTIRTYRHAKKIDLVIIDYLQAIDDDDNHGGNNTLKLSAITSATKRACNEVKVAMVALSQYSRDGYKDGQEPKINNFKYCGDIENEAELVLLSWRDPDGLLHIKIPKVKWADVDHLGYLVKKEPVTGCHQGWTVDTSTGYQEEKPKRRRRRDG